MNTNTDSIAQNAYVAASEMSSEDSIAVWMRFGRSRIVEEMVDETTKSLNFKLSAMLGEIDIDSSESDIHTVCVMAVALHMAELRAEYTSFSILNISLGVCGDLPSAESLFRAHALRYTKMVAGISTKP